MYRSGFLILLLAESITTCKAQQRKENTVGLFNENFLGYDQNGTLETCRLKSLKDCQPPPPSEKAYFERCKSLGHKTFRCGCTKYLCEKKLQAKEAKKIKTFTGFDLNGHKRTCQEKDPNLFCSQSIEPSDEYAFRCKRLGYTAFTCGCHDHLCSHKLPED